MTVYKIVKGSSGSFLCPPGHPNHFYELRGANTASQIYSNPSEISSLDGAAKNLYGDLPAHIVEKAQKLIADAPLVRSELWERMVYGYFRNCYSPDGKERAVNRLLIIGQAEYVDKGSRYDSLNRGDVVRSDDPRIVPEHHAAYLLVREYFPDAQPRLDLIEDASGGYGSKTCKKCKNRVQYEARVDAYAEAITAKTECPEGGVHEV